MNKKLISAVAIVLAIATVSVSAFAAPYTNYNFSKGWVTAEPQAYVPYKIWDAGKENMNILDENGNVSNLKEPQDMCVSRVNGDIAIADTKNNRIVILNQKGKCKQIINDTGTVQVQRTDEYGHPIYGLTEMPEQTVEVTVSPDEGEPYATTTVIPGYVTKVPDVEEGYGMKGFTYNGKSYTLAGPQGVAYDNEGNLFVCDSDNARIFRFTINEQGDYECSYLYDKPAGIDELLNAANVSSDEQGVIVDTGDEEPEQGEAEEGEQAEESETAAAEATAAPTAVPGGDNNKITYKPLKVAISVGGSMYVVSKGNYKGFIELSSDGSFTKFTGATKVKTTLSTLLRRLLTQEQKNQREKNLSTEYTNVFMDSDGMIFGTVANIEAATLFDHFSSKTEIGAAIKRIAPTGSDILKRNDIYPPSGDLAYTQERDAFSYFVDITVATDGIYSALDKNKGRVFTYNSDGELLYVFGGLGSTSGAFTNPVAIDIISATVDEEDTSSMTEQELEDYNTKGQMMLAVLDAATGQITIFQPTEYGTLLRKATMRQSQRKYDEAVELWTEVLKEASNSRLAYTNIGRIQYVREQYEEACDNFMKAYNQSEYMKAYAELRNEKLEVVMPYLMTVIIVAVIAAVVWSLVKKFKKFIKTGGRRHE